MLYSKIVCTICSAQDGESTDMNSFGCIAKLQTSDETLVYNFHQFWLILEILISCAIESEWNDANESRGWSTKLSAWTHAYLAFTVNSPSKRNKTKHQVCIGYKTYCTSYPTPATTWSWMLQVGYLTTCHSINCGNINNYNISQSIIDRGWKVLFEHLTRFVILTAS